MGVGEFTSLTGTRDGSTPSSFVSVKSKLQFRLA